MYVFILYGYIINDYIYLIIHLAETLILYFFGFHISTIIDFHFVPTVSVFSISKNEFHFDLPLYSL